MLASLTTKSRPLARRVMAPAMTIRYKSAAVSAATTTEETNKEEPSSGCPFTGNKKHPTLQSVFKIPVFGSLIPQISGTPPFNPATMYEYEREMRRKFGEFYSAGFPMFGRGVLGEVISMTDPNEMLKVIRMEGAYPSGLVNNAWTFTTALKNLNSPMIQGNDNGLLGQGERWKAQRTFLQTGMLDPRAARDFIPGIVSAAELASKGAPAASQQDQLNYYLNLCAFDMFSSFMFGELTNCAATAFQTNEKLTPQMEENMEFCRAAIQAMNDAGSMGRTPTEFLAHKLFGYKTARFQEFEDSYSTVHRIAVKKLKNFIDRYHANELNQYERSSYMFNAMQRMDSGEAQITLEEMLELCSFALFVGVDTTSGVTSWNLMHIALNPRVQEKLYDELSEAVKATGGKLTPKTLEKKSVPYLHACLRENYRLTPPFGAATFKRASKDSVEIHGIDMPKDSMFLLKNKFNDTDYLPDAKEFKPERWFPAEVEARKGTPLEDMDHALFRDSFGQGARRCPGSRVATNEMLSLLAQLVLDYEIRPPAHIQTLDDVPYGMTALISPTLPQLEFLPRQQPEPEERVA